MYIQVIYIEKRTRTKGSWGEIIEEIIKEISKGKVRKTYYRKSTKGNTIHKRSIFLSLAILCTAFGIAVGSQWLPEQARTLKYRFTRERRENNSQGLRNSGGRETGAF